MSEKMGPRQQAVDTLMEIEWQLNLQLERVRARIELLIGEAATERTVQRPNHLHLVPPPDEGA
jgi:hypothetical protein